jgi:hypothetical protein
VAEHWRKSLWLAALTATASLISFRSTYEPDLWWHLAQGREVAAGHLVRTNLFSATYAGYPQHYSSWLFDAGAYVLFTRIGPAAIQAAQALLIAATLAVVALAARSRASVASTIVVCALGLAVLEPRALPRPHVFSFLGLAACAYLIERARATRSWRPLRWTPLLVAAWSNIHLECVFGVALIGLFGASEWLRPRDLTRRDATAVIGVALAATLATAANPYGFGLLRHTWLNSFVPGFISIVELQPPYLPNYLAFYVCAALCGLAIVATSRATPDLPPKGGSYKEAESGFRLFDVMMVLIFGALGFRYLRLTPLLFVVSGALVARGLDASLSRETPRRFAAAAAVAAVLLCATVPLPGWRRGIAIGGASLEPRDLFSPEAMTFARRHNLAGPAFTSINLGGYVAWYLYPAARVFVDARLQAYPPEHFRAIHEASFDFARWDRLTAGVDWAVLSVPRSNPLSGAGRFDPAAWGTAYRDDAIEILVRRSGRYGPLAD